MSPDVFSGLISGVTGLVSGIVVALANHWLTKRKTAAEIEKLHAEAELTRAQARQITDHLANLSDKVTYQLPEVTQINETIVYTSERSDVFDFRVHKVDNAEGELTIKDGILYISRTNTLGTMQIWLQSYEYAGKAHLRVLPKNENISADRKLRISCEVKAVGGEQTLLFIMKAENAPLGVHMADKRHKWVSVDAYFRVSPGQNCQFRIDDRSVSAPNSSVQIRKLVLAERTS